ncbi:MAG TPA: hypothetical protein ENJ77_01320, partial [Candidatus Moranbacteria bacterium]|nr:hypothetical protein [Candidatus Moranbacteria bacterium]
MMNLRKKTLALVLVAAMFSFSFISVPRANAQGWPDIIGHTFGVTLERILEKIERVIKVTIKNQIKRA